MRLRQATVLCADYGLLRRDFPRALAGRSDAEVDGWLLQNCAFISAGQMARISEGGHRPGEQPHSPDNPGFAQNAPRVRLRSAFSIQNHSPFRTRDGSKNPGEGIRNRAYISSLATQIYPKSWFRNSSVRFWMDPRKCLVRLLI